MNELKTLIENSGGLKSLDQLLKTVADALNISVTQLQNNLPDYLTQIGRYGLINNITDSLFLSLLLGVAGSLIIFLALLIPVTEEWVKITKKRGVLIVVSPTLLLFIFMVSSEILKYWVSPQIYALKYLKTLLGM